MAHEWGFEHPEWNTRVEFDRAQAAVTARNLLDRAARRGSLVHAFHLPELGRVEAAGDAIRFVAER